LAKEGALSDKNLAGLESFPIFAKLLLKKFETRKRIKQKKQPN